MFISLKVISVLQKKRNKRDEKEVNKKENKVMTQLLEACVSLFISNVSLVSLFIQNMINIKLHLNFKKVIHLHQRNIK